MNSTKVLHYNQFTHLDDVKVKGNCFAYSTLYLYYVTMWRLTSSKPIDYSSFLTVLNEVDENKKYDLQNIQSCYETAAALMETVAPLHTATAGSVLTSLDSFVETILLERDAFATPVVYFFHYLNLKSNIIPIVSLNHIVTFYLASPNELHFFDAVSGVHKINITPGSSKNESHDLKELCFRLLFKENWILEKMFNNVTCLGMVYDTFRTPSPLTELQKKILGFILLKRNNPDFRDRVFYKDAEDKIKEFIDTSMSILNILDTCKQKTTNLYNVNKSLLFQADNNDSQQNENKESFQSLKENNLYLKRFYSSK